VIEGLGHGHDDVTPETALEPAAPGAALAASPALRQFTRITPDNIDSFHFHGDTSAYPISAVIAAPHDTRAAAILEGRYLESGGALEALRPSEVIADLLATLFRVGRLIDTVIAVAALSAALSLGVAIYLTLALRKGEIDTMFRLGARRSAMGRMLAAQLGLTLLAGGLLAATFMAPVAYHAEAIALRLVGGGS
jgi:putative ABC transport system permease protein